MPINFVTESYDKLEERRDRVDTFFQDLEDQLSFISAPPTAHMDIHWDGVKVYTIQGDNRIQDLSLEDKLKYYNQGLGLMKLAMNNTLYP